jgi:hypothetical protein
MGSAKISVSLNSGTLRWLDNWRGDVPRSRVVEGLVRVLKDFVEEQAGPPGGEK